MVVGSIYLYIYIYIYIYPYPVWLKQRCAQGSLCTMGRAADNKLNNKERLEEWQRGGQAPPPSRMLPRPPAGPHPSRTRTPRATRTEGTTANSKARHAAGIPKHPKAKAPSPSLMLPRGQGHLCRPLPRATRTEGTIAKKGNSATMAAKSKKNYRPPGARHQQAAPKTGCSPSRARPTKDRKATPEELRNVVCKRKKMVPPTHSTGSTPTDSTPGELPAATRRCRPKHSSDEEEVAIRSKKSRCSRSPEDCRSGPAQARPVPPEDSDSESPSWTWGGFTGKNLEKKLNVEQIKTHKAQKFDRGKLQACEAGRSMHATSPPPPLCQRQRVHAISMFNGMPLESQQSIGRDLTHSNWITPNARTCQSWVQRLFQNIHPSDACPGTGFEAAVLQSLVHLDWATMETQKARYFGIVSKCRHCQKVCRIGWNLSSTAQHMKTQRATILYWLNIPCEMPGQEDPVPIV